MDSRIPSTLLFCTISVATILVSSTTSELNTAPTRVQPRLLTPTSTLPQTFHHDAQRVADVTIQSHAAAPTLPKAVLPAVLCTLSVGIGAFAGFLLRRKQNTAESVHLDPAGFQSAANYRMVNLSKVAVPAVEGGALSWGMCNVVGDTLERPKEAALRNDDDEDDDDDELPSVDDLVAARGEFMRLRGKGDGTPGLAPGEILRPVTFPGYTEPVDLMALYERFDELLGESVKVPKVGDRVTGTVFDVNEGGASIDFGGKNIGFCPSEEISLFKVRDVSAVLAVGQRQQFAVAAPPAGRRRKGDEEFTLLSLKAIAEQVAWRRIQQFRENNLSFPVVLKGKNRGGYEVEVREFNLTGFLPKSQAGGVLATLPDSADPIEFMEQVVEVKVLDLDPERKRLVVSQRAANPRMAVGDAYQIGTVHEGIVESIQPYGVFLDLGGLRGLLHVSQISHVRVENVESLFQLGERIKVMVLSQDPVQGRLSLTTKRLEPIHGDMLTNRKAVYEKAEEMAERFRADIAAATKRMQEFEAALLAAPPSEGSWSAGPPDAVAPAAAE